MPGVHRRRRAPHARDSGRVALNIDILADRLRDYVANSPENAVQASYALHEDLVGVPLFDAPIVGVASADNPFTREVRESNYDDLSRPSPKC